MAAGISHLQLLPVLLAVFALIAFFTAYGLAVHEGYLNPVFPYISDAGGCPPQSCIFGQFLNIASLLGGVVIYIHCKHIKEFNFTELPLINRLNIVSLVFGWLACIGMSIVANFQVYNSLITHMFGAFMVFGLGNVYCWLQSIISFKMLHMGMSSALSCYTRFTLSFAVTVCFIATFVGGSVAGDDHSPVHNCSTTSGNEWKYNDPGYSAYLVSTFSEWIMAICFLLYFLTFYREFQKIQVTIKVEPRNAEIFSSSDNIVDVSANNMSC